MLFTLFVSAYFLAAFTLKIWPHIALKCLPPCLLEEPYTGF